MANGNPFFVQAADYSNSLNSLAQGISNFGQMQKQNQQEQVQLQQQEDQKVRMGELQEIVKLGDLDKVADFMLANPDMSNNVQRNIFGAMGIKDDIQKDQLKADTFKMLSNPDSIEQNLTQRIATIQARGDDPSHSVKELEAYKQSPQKFLQGLEGLASSSFSPEYKTWSKAMREPKDVKRKLFKVAANPSGEVVKYYSDGTEEIAGGDEKVKDPSMRRKMSYNQATRLIDSAKEGPKKAAGFASRIRDSIDGMDKLIDTGLDPQKAALINKALGTGLMGNLNLSAAEQEYMTHANDALYAILRPETGAAITDQEIIGYSRMYLPQPGDKPGTIKLKKQKMENQFKALRTNAGSVYEAGRIYGQGDQPQQTQQVQQAQQDYSQLPQQGVVMDGYMFNGGDPSDQSNWSKV